MRFRLLALHLHDDLRNPRYFVYLSSFTIFAIQLRVQQHRYRIHLEEPEHLVCCIAMVLFFLISSSYRYFDFPKLWRILSGQQRSDFLHQNGLTAAAAPVSFTGKFLHKTVSTAHYLVETIVRAIVPNDLLDSETLVGLKRSFELYLPLLSFLVYCLLLHWHLERGDLLNLSVLTIIVCFTIRSIIDEMKEASQKSFSAYVFSIWNVFDVALAVGRVQHLERLRHGAGGRPCSANVLTLRRR